MKTLVAQIVGPLGDEGGRGVGGDNIGTKFSYIVTVIATSTTDDFHLPGIQMKNSLRIDCNYQNV